MEPTPASAEPAPFFVYLFFTSTAKVMNDVDAPKGQFADSPRQRLGEMKWCDNAPEGQKHNATHRSFALSGRRLNAPDTQGVALGYGLVGLLGRWWYNYG